METEFENKTVAVVGLARSGLACCDVLTQLGARVIPWDGKPAEALTEAMAHLATLGLTPLTGGVALDYSQLDYVVTSPGVCKDAAVLQNAVAAGVPVLGEIEAAYRIARAPILAITGTNGKTTTTLLLGEMLRAAGIETYIAGNIAAGDIAMPLIQAAFAAPPETAIVAEISSFQLEWISTFRPKVAALLNISPDHGDRQTWEEYVKAKLRIFENQRPVSGKDIDRAKDDFAVIHYAFYEGSVTGFAQFHENYFIDAQKIPGQVYLFAGRDQNCCGVWRANGNLVLHNETLDSRWGKDYPVAANLPIICDVADVKLPGAHNLENIMAAAAMATAFGVGIEPIRQVATTFTGVVHRLEYVETIDEVKYVNNSMCTNADAFEKSLQALPEPKVVIAGGVFKGGDVAALANAVVQNNVRALVLIGRSALEIDGAARAAGYQNVHRAETLPDAVTLAAGLAQAGDTVLLAPACASFDMFADFEDRGDQFKAAVRTHPGASADPPETGR